MVVCLAVTPRELKKKKANGSGLPRGWGGVVCVCVEVVGRGGGNVESGSGGKEKGGGWWGYLNGIEAAEHPLSQA
jgi:hypothetical protein